MIQPIELLANALAKLAYLIFAIILNAVLKHKVHIVEEVLELQILIRVELGFNRSKIHWLLNDVKVIRDVQALWIDWFKEDVGHVVLA